MRKNIGLLTIWQGEWETRNEAVKNIILNRMHKVQKIQLKNCMTVVLDYVEASNFVVNNHVFNISESCMSIALKDTGGKVFSVLSYTKNGRRVHIAQFCDLLGHKVQGSFSKLLNALIELEQPKDIIHIVDRRYFTETTLIRNGFKRSNLKLGYKWTDFQRIYNEHSESRRSHRIYDNGQVEYVKIINQV